MKNIISKIAKTIGAGLLISMIPFGIYQRLSVEIITEEFHGKVKDEKFVAGEGFLMADKYTALVKLSNGREIVINSYENKARENDLRYNLESDIKIKEVFVRKLYLTFSRGFYYQKDHARYEIMD
jgi:hypothetical protein